ncbi:hypothetical protein [Moorena sp. SIO3B2]|uniref:hypothetical protein n=1 Tax=Moorena sp. SIO3B2 TaxID=2607827 RepID=UPI0013C92495|nr:hypothetical protein [Moorena sp. SIO3B2]NEP32925.1 hypothetical protein [Moorena sp. SIO3B2]
MARAVQNYQAGNIKGAIAIAFGVAYGQSHKMCCLVVLLSMGPKPKLTNGTMNGYPLNVSLIRFNKRLEQGRWVDVLNYAKNSNWPTRGYWRQKLNRIMAQARQQQAALEAKRKQLAVQNQIGSRANQRIQNNSQPASRPVSIAAPLPRAASGYQK